jgi:hypothetical protein
MPFMIGSLLTVVKFAVFVPEERERSSVRRYQRLEVNTMAVATAPRPTITNAIDALAELLEARAKECGEDKAASEMAVGAERARRLAVLFQRAGGLNAWQLEALMRHAAMLEAISDGGASEYDEPAWDSVRPRYEPEVDRLQRVVQALGFWSDEGILYRPSTTSDAA